MMLDDTTIQMRRGMITDNFSWEEAFHTSHREIANTFTDNQVLLNITTTAVRMEIVREVLGKPIIVSSWYRNPELNAAVGGAKNSDHLLGCAVDFICPKFGSPLEIAKELARFKGYLQFKQMILEHTWIHLSWYAIPNVIPKMEILSLLADGSYAPGITDKAGKPLV